VRYRLVACAIVSAITAAAALALPSMPVGTAQDQEATVRVVAPTDKVDSSTKTFDVAIDVENAQNLGGFVFILSFDGDVLKATSASHTDFIASTGREPVCVDPAIEADAVRLQCVTLRETPAGVDGSGTLAHITFESKKGGTSPLSLTRVELPHIDGRAQRFTIVDASVEVEGGGSSWLLPAIIIAAVVVGVIVIVGGGLALRMRRGAPAGPSDPGPGV